MLSQELRPPDAKPLCAPVICVCCLQIKDLQQQLAAAQQQSGASPTHTNSASSSREPAHSEGSNSSGEDAPSSPHTPPLTAGRSGARAGAQLQSAPAGGRKVVPGGGSGSSVWQQPVPWWQHAVLASLTAVSVAAYVQWENSSFFAVRC